MWGMVYLLCLYVKWFMTWLAMQVHFGNYVGFPFVLGDIWKEVQTTLLCLLHFLLKRSKSSSVLVPYSLLYKFYWEKIQSLSWKRMNFFKSEMSHMAYQVALENLVRMLWTQLLSPLGPRSWSGDIQYWLWTWSFYFVIMSVVIASPFFLIGFLYY